MSLELPFGLKPTNELSNFDERYGPHPTIQDALMASAGTRKIGLVQAILVEGKAVDYWFESGINDSDLVLKTTSPSTVPGLQEVTESGARTTLPVTVNGLTTNDMIKLIDWETCQLQFNVSQPGSKSWEFHALSPNSGSKFGLINITDGNYAIQFTPEGQTKLPYYTPPTGTTGTTLEAPRALFVDDNGIVQQGEISGKQIKVKVITVTLADLGLTAFGTDQVMLEASRTYLNGLDEFFPEDTLYQLEVFGEAEPVTPSIFLHFKLRAFTMLSIPNYADYTYDGTRKITEMFPLKFKANNTTYTLSDNALFEESSADGELAFHQTVINILNQIPGVVATLPSDFNWLFDYESSFQTFETYPFYSVQIDMSYYPNGFELDFRDHQDSQTGVHKLKLVNNSSQVLVEYGAYVDGLAPGVLTPYVSSSKFRFEYVYGEEIQLGATSPIALFAADAKKPKRGG